MSGGGGTASTEPAWIWDLGRQVGHSTARRFIEGIREAGDNFGASGVYDLTDDPASEVKYTFEGALARVLAQGDSFNPFYDAASGGVIPYLEAYNTERSADDADSLFAPGLLPWVFNLLYGSRTGIDSAAGGTDVIAKATSQAVTHLNTLRGTYLTDAEYDITTLTSAAITAAIADATEELSGSVPNVTAHVGTLSREATARGNADSSLTSAASGATVGASANVDNTIAHITPLVTNGIVASTALTDSNTFQADGTSTRRSLVETDVEAAVAVVTDATTGLGSAITAALVAASSAVNSSLVNSAVTAFDQAGLGEHSMAMNRFSGQMVDINAVYGMPFILGQSLLIKDHQNKVASFRSDLNIKLYDRAFAAYTDMFSRALELHLDQLKVRIQERLAVYQGLISERAKMFLGSFLSHMEAYSRGLGVYGDFERGSLVHQSGLVDKILTEHGAFARSQAETVVRTAVDAKMSRLNSRDEYLRQDHKAFVNAMMGAWNVRLEIDKAITDVQKTRIDAMNVRDLRNLETSQKYLTWTQDLIGKGINYLAAPAGVATSPERLSQAGKIAAGTASGASMGTAVLPGWGTAIGAVLGGTAGALS